ncbi:putative CmcJ-like methyltransferase [Viridothelium virens]|uniref:Putative CmcJ-like methyltransferase n=1 Tax=Viridothelium virens TaxID=1048519 RepID=A0A6A6H3L9_VIRVR|nr:putative CmcJ-like methyltransferase [Viridothelium virens]
MEYEMIEIPVTDMRGSENLFNLDEHGFAIFKVDAGLSYDDYHNSEQLSKFFRKLEAVLKDHLGVSRVDVFRHGMRKRDERWPTPKWHTYTHEQPTTVVHIDAAPEGTRDEIRRQLDEDADELLKRRYQWFNFWKPLKGPVNDWPLLLCDASTVDRRKDIEVADLLYPDYATENSQLYCSTAYKWYYLSNQTVDEVLVFKQMDSLEGSYPGVPHCSCENPLTPKGEAPRESIEVRAMAYYDS